VKSSDGTLWVGDQSGRVTAFTSNGDAKALKGDGHAGPVTGMTIGGDSIFSTGFDDCVREIDPTSSTFKYGEQSPLPVVPQPDIFELLGVHQRQRTGSQQGLLLTLNLVLYLCRR
jgi:hypothetical protein